MLDTLFSGIERAFVELSGRRLLYLAFLLTLASGSLFVFNEVTGYSFYSKIDRQLSALERLQELEHQNISRSVKLAPVYDNVVRQLAAAAGAKNRSVLGLSVDWRLIVKFLSIAGIPFFFLFVAISHAVRGDREWGAMFGGALMLTLILVGIGVLLPELRSLRLTAGMLFAVQVVTMTLLAIWTRRPKGAKSAAVE